MDAVASTLGRGEIHERWEAAYRTDANERVYEAMFDRRIKYLPPRGSHLLDAQPPGMKLLGEGSGGGVRDAELASGAPGQGLCGRT
jgi:hypothetical protein